MLGTRFQKRRSCMATLHALHRKCSLILDFHDILNSRCHTVVVALGVILVSMLEADCTCAPTDSPHTCLPLIETVVTRLEIPHCDLDEALSRASASEDAARVLACTESCELMRRVCS